MNLEELQPLYDFKDCTVFVRGGAGVLEGEIACALLGCSANVVILAHTPGTASTRSWG